MSDSKKKADEPETTAEITERVARESAKTIEAQLLIQREQIEASNEAGEEVGQPPVTLPDDNKERGSK